MLYSIVGIDVADSLEKRMAARPDHVARLKLLLESGKLLIAGPNPAVDSAEPGKAGFTGSIIIAEFEDLEKAQAWANDDPYLLTGVYEAVTVKPFNKALP